MKKCFVLIFFFAIFCLFFGISEAEAFVNYESDLDWIDGKCLDNNKCIALCSYYQTNQNIPAAGVAPTKYYSGIYIYYYFNGNWQISWDKGFINGLGGPGKTVTKKGNIDDVFGKQVFIQTEAYNDLTNKSICPKYAYVDTGGANSEVCFDNDGEYCDNKGGWMTSFTSDRKSEHSDYNISNDIANYFDNYKPNFDDCTSLEKCNLDSLMNNFVNDFQIQYLKNNKIPALLNNNPTYKKRIEELKKQFIEVEENLKVAIDNDETLNQQEKEDKKNEISNNISDALNKFEEKLEEITQEDNIGELQPGDPVTGCEVIPPVIRKWINNILNFVRYVALALVIVLGALDFMKAAGSGEPDTFKKAGQSFLKRMIAVVILFLLPYIVDFILNMVELYGVQTDNIDCMKEINQ